MANTRAQVLAEETAAQDRSSLRVLVTSELQNEFSEQVKEVRSVCQNHYGGYRINFPRFNGVRLSDWLFKAEQFFSLDMTSDDLKVKVASSHFDALAATWHQSIEELILWKHVKHDWVTYKLLLEGKYNKHVEDSIAELKQLQEVDGIDEYHARFELIRTRVNLSEAFLVSAYLTGLQIDTQINVRMFGPQSIQQCLMLGRLYEKAHQKKLIIRKDGDDYRKGVMPLNVSSEDDGPLSNIHVPNALHKDRECFEGKHSIQQEISAGMENFLQQEELTCDSDFVLESDRWCVPYANLKTESVNQEKGELGTGNKGEVKGCLECVSQPQKVNSTFEDFNKANATMNQLLSPIGFVVDNLQSGGGSDIFCDDLQSGGGSDIFRVQTFASPVVVGDFQETPWILNVESKGILIQGELGIVGKIEVDKESVEMLRRCNSGQTIGAYGSEIKRWDINNRVWDPGGSIFRNFSFKLKLWFWFCGQIWIKIRLLSDGRFQTKHKWRFKLLPSSHMWTVLSSSLAMHNSWYFTTKHSYECGVFIFEDAIPWWIYCSVLWQYYN